MSAQFIIMFKSLGYPYTISKTSMSAVGSPHAWPQLLGALQWLIELLVYDREATMSGGHAAAAFDESLPDRTAKEGDAKFIEYLGLAYGAFLGGNDEEYEDLEHEFTAALAAQTSEVKQLVAAQEEDQEKLMRDIEAEKATGATLPAKKEKLLEGDTAAIPAASSAAPETAYEARRAARREATTEKLPAIPTKQMEEAAQASPRKEMVSEAAQPAPTEEQEVTVVYGPEAEVLSFVRTVVYLLVDKAIWLGEKRIPKSWSKPVSCG